MKVSILIVTHGKDFPWLRWSLKSIAKFATGFHEVVVCIPSSEDWHQVLNFATGYSGQAILRFNHFDQWPGKGFVHHMDRIIHADQICPQADFILHMDSDCIFTEPVTPEDYFWGGKPVLIGAPYPWIVAKFNNPHHLRWKEAVERALGGTSEREFMRRHPAVHYRDLYQQTRDAILKHTRQPSSDYIRASQNTFPQTFAEFPTLGEVAWRDLRESYYWINQESDPWPKDKLIQFWSYGPMNKPNNVWQGGTMVEMVPQEVFNRLLA
jgi:hypothetical protein